MSTLEPLELQTQRLTLRPLVAGDAEELFRMHADHEVMRFSNAVPWSDVAQAIDLIKSSLEWLASGRHLCLGIASRETSKVVGTCTLFDIVSTSGRAEVGFLLSSQCWGKGYMRESLSALLSHAFDEIGLNRVEADTDPRNARAIGLLEALGFQREGLLRERWIVAGQKSDSAIYGLLHTDWSQVQGRKSRSVA